ncbi:hypothetical protein [Marinobacterium aestuariivivens]|uniref:Indoleamine 2,3-dioxygenase n=1 Tax=Marinobacterium aestuariivivens TaxID=1698799 RepID=A0ABW2A2P6_9GAMM
MSECLRTRGFLPCEDPDTEMRVGASFAMLDELAQELPSLLMEPDCRSYLAGQMIPDWPYETIPNRLVPQARLYYLRLGFLASGYINQIGQPACHRLPANIARPLARICHLLHRPPILSYDGYVLYNWKRFDRSQPIGLGNIDTLQNFVHLYDEHWFILVHVEIEAVASRILDAILELEETEGFGDETRVNAALTQIADALDQLSAVLKRMPEKMSDDLFYSKVHPYIGRFQDVEFEDVDSARLDYQGEPGAQSTIMPTLTGLMKVPHELNRLTRHLHDMREYMPEAHRRWVEYVDTLPDLKPLADAECWNRVLEGMASFREVHYHWAIKYIARRSPDPHDTGGSPYLKPLKFLIDETRAHMK